MCAVSAVCLLQCFLKERTLDVSTGQWTMQPCFFKTLVSIRACHETCRLQAVILHIIVLHWHGSVCVCVYARVDVTGPGQHWQGPKLVCVSSSVTCEYVCVCVCVHAGQDLSR